MAPKKSIFPREGIFTADSLTILLKNTILNPTITLPIFLALQYTPAGKTLLSSFGADGAKIFRRFKVLLALGVVGRINWFFSHRSSNNWTTDTFSAPSEIVVVTGGSSGIGAATVQEFVQRGVEAVVVLDVQPLLYEARMLIHPSRANRR